MLDRRQLPRNRVYYGGMVAFNGRNSTIACVVRNFSMYGAKIEFECAALVPDEVDFEIARRAISCTAHLVRRNRDAAGVVSPMCTRKVASFRCTGRASCGPASVPTGG
jgi:hypothetical protein